MKPATATALFFGSVVLLTGILAWAFKKPKSATPLPTPQSGTSPISTTPTESAEAKGVRILRRCKEAVDTLNPSVIQSAANEIESSAPDTSALLTRISKEVQTVNDTSEDYEAHEQAKEALFYTVGELRDLAAIEMTGEQKTLTLAIADKLETLTR